MHPRDQVTVILKRVIASKVSPCSDRRPAIRVLVLGASVRGGPDVKSSKDCDRDLPSSTDHEDQQDRGRAQPHHPERETSAAAVRGCAQPVMPNGGSTVSAMGSR